jgi:anti-sigma B factor antagonist
MTFSTDDLAVDDETRVVAVWGDLDLQTAPQLKARLGYVLDQGVNYVCVDLLAVSYCDSSGFSPMISAYQRLGRQGGALTVACPEHMRQVFEITGLADLFGIHRDRDAAVAYLGQLREARAPGT